MERPRIEGNFHKISSITIGTAGTMKKSSQKTYWYAEESEDGFFNVQILTPTNKRIGNVEQISLEEFLKKFIPDISYPVPVEKIDEKMLTFFVMMMKLYFEHNRKENVLSLLEAILDSKYPFAFEVKNNFNAMAILLKEQGYINEAIKLYKKALLTAPKNPVLYFNLARLYFDMKEYNNCTENLLHAFDVANDKKQIVLFLSHLHSKHYIPEQYTARVQNIIRMVS